MGSTHYYTGLRAALFVLAMGFFQKDVIAGVVELVKEHLSIHPGTAFLFGTYSIGKERVFMAVSTAMGFEYPIVCHEATA